MEITSAALFVSLSLVLFGIFYYYFTTRNRERLALLERGLPADYFRGETHYLPLLLVLGVVSIGIAVGLASGAVLKKIPLGGLENVAIPFAVFFSLGVSLLFAYWLLLISGRSSTRRTRDDGPHGDIGPHEPTSVAPRQTK